MALSLVAAISVGACQPAADDAALRNAEKRIATLELDLAIAEAQNNVLRETSATVPAPEAAPTPEPVADDLDGYKEDPGPKAAVEMCFKDYCPCEPPQGGPDTVLCDQLEQGIEVDMQLMIAGRGMREVRRQLATGDY